MGLGLLYGTWLDTSMLKMAILPLTFLMVYPMMVNLNFKQLLSGGDTRLQVVTQVINFLVIPFLGLAIGQMFFADKPFLVTGLLLTSLLPTSGMTISWTGFARGNMPAAVKMTVVGLVLGSLLTPFYLQWFLGSSVEIPLLKVFREIIVIVFLPMALGYLTQKWLVKRYGMARFQKDIKGQFPPLSTLGVLGIVFVAMAMKASVIVGQPLLLVVYALPLLLLYAINFVISTVVGKYLFNRGDGIALVYGSVMRNLSIALAIAMTVFRENGSEIALIIALAYIIQVQAGAWYVRWTDRIFGAAPPEVAGDVMKAGVITISPNENLRAAIAMLEREHIHSLVVQVPGQKPLGVLNTRALFDHVVSVSKDVMLPVSSVALDAAVVVELSTPLDQVVKMMQAMNAYKAIVVDKQQQSLGVITEMVYLDKIVHRA